MKPEGFTRPGSPQLDHRKETRKPPPAYLPLALPERSKLALNFGSVPQVQVLVADDVSVNPFEEGIQYCYCDITADPLNPNRLFASSLVETSKARVPGLYAKLSNVAGFYSHDGGKSWTRAFYLVADNRWAYNACRDS
ncbi:MAG: hypothetical protein ACKV0T_10375 [Planctomycetales bacterium]